MERLGGIGALEREKLAAEKAYSATQNEAANPGAQMQAMTGCDRPSTPHPREALLSQIMEHEQKLLDKLVALRELRREFNCLSRHEAEQVLRVSVLAQQVGY